MAHTKSNITKVMISIAVVVAVWFVYKKYFAKTTDVTENTEGEIKTEADLKNMLLKAITDPNLPIAQKRQTLKNGLIDSLRLYNIKLNDTLTVEIMAEIAKYPELKDWNVNN